MEVHLVDGTYELFRYHFAPNNRDPRPEVRHRRACWARCSSWSSDGATHVGGGHRPRHRVVPQRPVGRLQVVGRHAPRAAGPVPAGRGRAGRGRVHGVAPGRVRGRRRHGRRRRDGGGRRAGRAGRHLHAGQGPRPVRRRQGRAARPAQGDVLRRGRGRASGSGCRRRRSPTCLALVGDTRRRVPRPARLGRQVGGRGAAPAGATSRTSRPTRALGRQRARRAPSSTPPSATSSSWPCCSGASPPSSSTRRPSATSTSCAGPARRPEGFAALCDKLGAPHLVPRAVFSPPEREVGEDLDARAAGRPVRAGTSAVGGGVPRRQVLPRLPPPRRHPAVATARPLHRRGCRRARSAARQLRDAARYRTYFPLGRGRGSVTDADRHAQASGPVIRSAASLSGLTTV